jgi:H2-forming N5,N10-methylenetetrahydromethanopterin dehydrogenase-like enzyme
MKLKTTVFSADVKVVDDDIEACWEADVIILAVPYAAQTKQQKR